MKKCENCDYREQITETNKTNYCNYAGEIVGLNNSCGDWKGEGEIEKVNHPAHYNQGKIEVIDVIEDWNLNFHQGNAVKYIARAEHKGKKEEDIKKAIWYLERELKKQK